MPPTLEIRPRVMPCLLLDGDGSLVKTERFSAPRYLGDPINAVRIFNDKEIDELLLCDIAATARGSVDFDLLEMIVSEAFVPVTYGGGVSSVDDVERLLSLGIEKVAVNTAAVENPALIDELSATFGSSTVVVSIDARRRRRRYRVVTAGGTVEHRLDPVDWAREAARRGAGEILIGSVDRDGTLAGYDTALVGAVAGAVDVPVVALGGAASVDDLVDIVRVHGASAAAAGALFVFQGRHRAVLISFPDPEDLDARFGVGRIHA